LNSVRDNISPPKECIYFDICS